MDVERAERDLQRALGTWVAASTAVGAGLLLAGRRASGRGALAAAGTQTLLWAGVDAAVLGASAAGARRRTGPPPAARLRRLLLVNAAADVGYVAVGAALAARPAAAPARLRRAPGGDERLAAHGVAVVVQGAFLLVLDAVTAHRLR